jgi:hypothetical protein
LAGSTRKKVLVRRFQREPVAGYVDPIEFQQAGGIELISASGAASSLSYDEIKEIAFVREFETGAEPERRTFNTRPKMAGLWVTLRYRDGDTLEGVLPNNLLQIEPHGVTVIPPDPYSNIQRIFAPRAALVSVQVLGVVGSPLTRRKPKPPAKDQIGLFDQA